jgi:hypothetical protein
VSKIPVRKNSREDYLFWVTVSEVIDHHGRENMAEQSSPHIGSQEAEKGNIGRG